MLFALLCGPAPELLLALLFKHQLCIINKAARVVHPQPFHILLLPSFGIDDADVINAIGCHVFGRMNMTKLDKILYVADKAEFTRTYEGVDKLRDMAKKDLNGAVLMTMNNSIGHLLARGIEPTDESLMIRQAIKRETENNKGDIK